jgi:hypothetical protein
VLTQNPASTVAEIPVQRFCRVSQEDIDRVVHAAEALDPAFVEREHLVERQELLASR